MNKFIQFAKKLYSIPFLLSLVLIASVFFVSANLLENTVSSNNTKVVSPEWNQFQTVSLQDSLTIGIPIDGEPGITETVQEIMDREAMLPAD
ncbi:MAG TPA: hypothetical protein PKD83_03095, partial [Ignavibacteria bacterium]|nr:hypothetical protein [Ignavibacteria bacterium]